MTDWYQLLARPLLFSLDPERAHHLSIDACRLASKIPFVRQLCHRAFRFEDPILNCRVAGIDFANPVGLAAGWDKSGVALHMLDAFGFGFAEIGSVSARPSVGNPKPRLFRLLDDQAIVVNYGLPNDGAEVVAERAAHRQMSIPLGINIVKTNDGPWAEPATVDEVMDDYLFSVRTLHPFANYIALNLSCPNAVGGSDFFYQDRRLADLLARMGEVSELRCPIFLKVAPTNDSGTLDRMLEACDRFAFVKGFMFNLPFGKPATLKLQCSPEKLAQMPGAVSGRPVAEIIDANIADLFRRMPRERYAIIGVGGIFSAEDAYRKIRLGASLVQVYTSMVYEGPAIVSRINAGLASLLRRDGLRSLQEAVGIG